MATIYNNIHEFFLAGGYREANAYDSRPEYSVASGYRGAYTRTQANTLWLVGIAKDIEQYERILRGRGVPRSEKNILSVTCS